MTLNIKLLSIIIFLNGFLAVYSSRYEVVKKILDSSEVTEGVNCSTNDFPYLVLIGLSADQYFVKPKCGGSLISRRFVLTAAHCVSLEGLVVVAAQSGRSPILRKVQDQFVYKDYNPVTLEHDIAILRLEFPVHRSAQINYVHLPPSPRHVDLLEDCHRAVTMGWGLKQAIVYRRRAALKCELMPVISNELCAIMYKGVDISITNDTICTYTTTKGGSCQSEAGGPLICGNNIQEAIVSIGKECESGKYPGVYTRVDRYIDFIKAVVNMENSGMKLRIKFVLPWCIFNCCFIFIYKCLFQIL